MGWSYTWLDYRIRKPIEELKRLVTCDNENVRQRVLDAALMLNQAYIAFEVTDRRVSPPKVSVEACIFLVRMNRGDQENFGYKGMHENDDPVEANCPQRILDLLTPTTNENALAWRARCRANLAKRAAVKLTTGSIIHLDPPIEHYGDQIRSVECLDARNNRFKDLASGSSYRIPWLRKAILSGRGVLSHVTTSTNPKRSRPTP